MATADRGDPSDTHSGATPLEGIEELLRLLAAASALRGSANPPGLNAPQAYGQAMQLFGQVMLAWAASGLRAWARTAEIYAASLPAVMNSLADATGRSPRDPGDQARTLDELRASWRELAELPGRESQRLRMEIERIFRGGAPDAGPAGGPGADAHWRRWEPKP